MYHFSESTIYFATLREKERERIGKKINQRMATAIVRSALSRAAIGAAPKTSLAPKRRFSSSAGHDDAYEAAKWEKITYLGIASCTALAAYVLSKGHHHGEDPPVSLFLFHTTTLVIRLVFITLPRAFVNPFVTGLSVYAHPQQGVSLGYVNNTLSCFQSYPLLVRCNKD
ncbi:unnamed protein product [Brassica rapa subsp. narinosa]